jgi:hypothetical protein
MKTNHTYQGSNFNYIIVPPPDDLEKILEQLGNRIRKLTLHSENPKHPGLVWCATPNRWNSPYKQGQRGATPAEAAYKLLVEINKVTPTTTK